MESKKIIWVALSICLLLIIGVLLFIRARKPVAVNENGTAKQEDQAQKPTGISACDSLANKERDGCRQPYLITSAAQSGDLNACQSVADKALAADCSSQASFSLAIQKRDKKYCDNIANASDKKNCLKVLAGMGVK